MNDTEIVRACHLGEEVKLPARSEHIEACSRSRRPRPAIRELTLKLLLLELVDNVGKGVSVMIVVSTLLRFEKFGTSMVGDSVTESEKFHGLSMSINERDAYFIHVFLT
jgi:hypothetical protein